MRNLEAQIARMPPAPNVDTELIVSTWARKEPINSRTKSLFSMRTTQVKNGKNVHIISRVSDCPQWNPEHHCSCRAPLTTVAPAIKRRRGTPLPTEGHLSGRVGDH